MLFCLSSDWGTVEQRKVVLIDGIHGRFFTVDEAFLDMHVLLFLSEFLNLLHGSYNCGVSKIPAVEDKNFKKVAAVLAIGIPYSFNSISE